MHSLSKYGIITLTVEKLLKSEHIVLNNFMHGCLNRLMSYVSSFQVQKATLKWLFGVQSSLSYDSCVSIITLIMHPL